MGTRPPSDRIRILRRGSSDAAYDGADGAAADEDDDDASRWPIITFAIDTANAITTRARDARRRTGNWEGEEAGGGGRPTTHMPESADDELLVLVGMMRGVVYLPGTKQGVEYAIRMNLYNPLLWMVSLMF
jgi:hypothetical protein